MRQKNGKYWGANKAILEIKDCPSCAGQLYQTIKIDRSGKEWQCHQCEKRFGKEEILDN